MISVPGRATARAASAMECVIVRVVLTFTARIFIPRSSVWGFIADRDVAVHRPLRSEVTQLNPTAALLARPGSHSLESCHRQGVGVPRAPSHTIADISKPRGETRGENSLVHNRAGLPTGPNRRPGPEQTRRGQRFSAPPPALAGTRMRTEVPQSPRKSQKITGERRGPSGVSDACAAQLLECGRHGDHH